MNYPPITLNGGDTFIIAQLSDLHLTGQIGQAPSYQRFLQILTLATKNQPDLLLLTGDLVNDGIKEAYDWLFATLENTGLNFVCIAGNHDVTLEHDKHLDFNLRTFKPITKDTRLLQNHTLTITLSHSTWRLVLLNSAVGGQIYGQLSADDLTWLQHTLDHHTPTIIAMHHHPINVGSAWIDTYRLKNDTKFWHIINQHPNVHAILCGHVHQAHTLSAPTQHSCTVYTCPSTDRQFMPHQDSFMLDKQQGGLRILQLQNGYILTSNTQRYSVYPK